MAEKYYGINAYSYCGNNPLKYIDPYGLAMDNFIFNEKGKFEQKVVVPNEPHKIIFKQKEGEPIIAILADQINDPVSISNKTSISVVSNEDIVGILESAGVYNEENHGLISGSKYLLNESNASKNEGKLDFIGNGESYINPDTFYITQTLKDGYVAHNGYNY